MSDRSTLTRTTATQPDGAGAFTLEKMREAMRLIEQIPPCPFFASSDWFPKDHFLKFTHDGRDYVAAHPDLWAKVPAADRGQVQSIAAIEIVELDLGTSYANRKKAEFMTAMRAVLGRML